MTYLKLSAFKYQKLEWSLYSSSLFFSEIFLLQKSGSCLHHFIKIFDLLKNISKYKCQIDVYIIFEKSIKMSNIQTATSNMRHVDWRHLLNFNINVGDTNYRI